MNTPEVPNSPGEPDPLDRALDASLRRQFRPGSAAALLAAVRTATPPPSPMHISWWQRPTLKLAIAATIAVAATGVAVYSVKDFVFPQRPIASNAGGYDYSNRPLQTMQQAYDTAVKNQMKPEWDCRNDPALFAKTFTDQTGQPMKLDALPAGVDMTGLSGGNIISNRTVMLLGHADGEPVVVFVDKGQAAPKIAAVDGGLHVYASKVGSANVYEVSKLNSARLTRYLIPLASTTCETSTTAAMPNP